MIEAEFVLGCRKAGLDRPAQAGDAGQFGERCASGGEDDVVGPLFRILAAAAHQQPVLPLRILRPEQPQPRPVIQARAFRALAGGMTGPSVGRQCMGEQAARRRLERAAADPHRLVAAHRQDIGLLTRLQHTAQPPVRAIQRVPEHERAGHASVEGGRDQVTRDPGLVANMVVAGIAALARRAPSSAQA